MCGDDTNRGTFQPCFYGHTHTRTESLVHEEMTWFVVVAHFESEVIDDEGREGGVSRLKSALNERNAFIVLSHSW